MFGAGNAQLPLPPMLMFDRITSIGRDGGAHGKGHVLAELDVRPDLWFFPCHFQGDPVMPGCLGLDALWQMVGFHLGWLGSAGRGRALGVGEVKLSGQVLPTMKKVVYGVDIKRVRQGRWCSASPTAGSRPMASACTRCRTCASACFRPRPRRRRLSPSPRSVAKARLRRAMRGPLEKRAGSSPPGPFPPDGRLRLRHRAPR